MSYEQKVVEYQGLQSNLDEMRAVLAEGFVFDVAVPVHQGSLLFFVKKKDCYANDCPKATKENVVKAVESLTEAPKKKKGRPKKVKEETPVVVEADTFSLTGDIPGTV